MKLTPSLSNLLEVLKISLLGLVFSVLVAIVIPAAATYALRGAPTNVITRERVSMPSPPSALEAPALDGMSGLRFTNSTSSDNWHCYTTNNSPAFADGVLTAAVLARLDPGFFNRLTSKEQVALCARVWQQAQNRVTTNSPAERP